MKKARNITKGMKMITAVELTHKQNRILGAWRCFMTCRIVTCAALSLWIGVIFNGSILEAATLPTVDEILQELHISSNDRERIRQGEIVDWSASEGSERELALGMAFLVKAMPENLAEMYREALVLKDVPVITAHGRITGEGTMRISLE